MRVTVDDGVELEVVRRGEGLPLLLVHGFGGLKEDFADHLDALAVDHEVVAFDHRGHGESGKTGDPSSYSLKRMAADVLAVADACGFDRFRLLGFSMGGMVVQHVVLDAPQRIDALVLMGTCPGPPAGVDPSGARAAAAIVRDRGLAHLKELLDAHEDPLESPARLRLLEQRPGYREYCDHKFLSQDPEMYAELVVEITTRDDLIPELAAVTCPTLVIVGEQDQAMLEGSHALAATIPGARLSVIPDAGHSPQFEHPEAWLAAVTGFLASLDRP